MSKKDLGQDPRMIDWRKSIDHFDISFLNLLTERMRVVKKVMYIKEQQQIDVKRSDARLADMRKLIEMSVELKLESSFFEKILNLVFQDAIEDFYSDSFQNQKEQLKLFCEDLDLEVLRNTVLNLDKSLCLVLAERFKVVKRIGTYKHSLGIPPLDPVRWQQVLDHKAEVARSLGVHEWLIKDIFNCIHEVALSIEDHMAGANA